MQSSAEALDGALDDCHSFSEDHNINIKNDCGVADPKVYCTTEHSPQVSSTQNKESELTIPDDQQSFSSVQFNQAAITSSMPIIFSEHDQSFDNQKHSTINVSTSAVESNDEHCKLNENIHDSNKMVAFSYKEMDPKCQEENVIDMTGTEISQIIFAAMDPDVSEQPQIIFTKPSSEEPKENAESLEDYIDVVTTYQCKFCRFSCQWKSGLMSHIRNCHLSDDRAASKIPLLTYMKGTATELQSTSIEDDKIENESTEMIGSIDHTDNVVHYLVDSSDAAKKGSEELERHIYLCGECSQGFDTLSQCKAHMIKEHKISLGEPSSKPKKHSKRKVKKQCQNSQSEEACQEEEDKEIAAVPSPSVEQSSNGELVAGKRSMKRAKSSENEFFFETKKKKERKDSLGERAYRCNEPGCNCRFCSDTNLDYHSQCHQSEEGKPYGCPECAEAFEQWRNLLMHLWKEHLIDLDLYTCAQCGYKSYSQFKLNIHLKIHGDARDFMCHTCGKSFKQHSQLRNHSVIHMDRELKRTGQKRWYSMQECDVCQRVFSDSKSLSKHKQAVHCKIKPYVCSFCGHTSARKAMLQLHIRQHTGEKPYSCEHCDYKTGDHNSLRRHRMRHTGSKPYKCSHCSYACIQAISLKTHLKNKHPGLEGTYSCSLCGFRSVSKENLMNHIADHNRGAIPATVNQKRPEIEVEAPQLHLPESSSQLEGMTLPGNMISAQLICSCLNALTQDGETIDLPPGVITSASDGTQTITIQLPANADEETGEQYYFTIQQAVSSGDINSQTTQLNLLDGTELKLGSGEHVNVNEDYIISDVVSALLEEEKC